MGCISAKQVKNPKHYNSNKQNTWQVQPALYKSKIGKSKVLTQRIQQPIQTTSKQTFSLPKIKKTTSFQFISAYQITKTLKQATRLQGPKMLTNKITGTTCVLRVYNRQKIDEQRLKKYHQLMGFQLYTDEQENFLVVEQYCSGKSISQLYTDHTQSQFQQERQNQPSNQQSIKHSQALQLRIHKMLLQVYDIIAKFHSKQMCLGNLNLFSFKNLSDFGQLEIRLVQLNVEKQSASYNQEQDYSMGHAHRNSIQSDWEFFGYLLQYYLSPKSPIFIPHKMQYIESDTSLAYSPLISSLLKGRQTPRKQLEQVDYETLKISNPNILYGYKFCNDVLRLIKARKRRNKHKSTYYSKQIFTLYQQKNSKEMQDDTQNDQVLFNIKNIYNPEQYLMLSQENLHKLQTERILESIEEYIGKLNMDCQQHFINYSRYGENFRKLKQVFLIPDKNKKMEEFKQLIPQIK